MRILITGGVKSGKSTYALGLARSFPGGKTFLATAVAFDDEMRERIQKHKRERGDAFVTIEEPVEIDKYTGNNLIMDCITVWMNNLFHHGQEERWEEILSRFLDGLGKDAVIVTNETGLGNIPMDGFTRKYNRYLGAANCLTASRMDRVYVMVSGLPLRVK